MPYVKGRDGRARSINNPLEGSVGDIDLNNITSASLTASGNISASYLLGNGSAISGLRTSQLNNDSGFITSATANVISINGQTGAVTLSIPNAYGDSNVTSLLAAFGSNSISTSGNVTVGNLVLPANAHLFGQFSGTSSTRSRIQTSDTGNTAFTIVSVIPGVNNTGNLSSGLGVWTNPDTGNASVMGLYSYTTDSRLLSDAFGSAAVLPITVYLGNLEAVRITTSGNVGIGNANPVDLLSVQGNAYVSGNITGNTAGFAIGYRDIPQVSFSANASIATTDAGKHYYSTSASNLVLTIANNASQAFAIGSAINIINRGTGTMTIAQDTGVTLYIAGNTTSGNRTLSSYGAATIQKVETDVWFVVGTGLA